MSPSSSLFAFPLSPWLHSLWAWPFSPQSHFTWAARDLRKPLQWGHWETGRPFLFMCWSFRSVQGQSQRLQSELDPGCRDGSHEYIP